MHKFLNKVICNYLQLNAGNTSGSGLPSSFLPVPHSAVSSLCWLTTQKKWLHYTLNPTLHNTLTIHTKHAVCHKSLNSQNSLSLLPSLLLPLFRPVTPTASPVPQLPNHMVCHHFVTGWCGTFFHNACEKAWWTLFTLSPVLDLSVHPVRRLGRWAMWGWASS